MGADFYEDDYGYGGGGGDTGYYDGGGGDFYYGYGFDTGLPPDYAPGQLPDLPIMPGLSPEEIMFAWEERMAIPPTFEPGVFDWGQYQVIPDLPEVGLPTIPLPSVYDYWQSPPYIPTFGEDQYFPLPPPPSDQPNLPPYCPAGQYHPYPIGHPQQNVCAPFPTAQTPGAQQRSPQGQQPSSSGGASRPPTQQQRPPQQQCPSGYYRASNGQCLPIPRCTSPGTIFDGARGICVPQGQAVSPLPSEAKDLLSNLKDIPWWVWLAAGGLLLLSQGESKTTTVRYRRAS